MSGFVVMLRPIVPNEGESKAVGPFVSATDAETWARDFNRSRGSVDSYRYGAMAIPLIASGQLCPCGCATPMPQSFADHSAQSVQAIAAASGITDGYCTCCGGPPDSGPGPVPGNPAGEHGLCHPELDGIAPADPFSGIPNADDSQNARI